MLHEFRIVVDMPFNAFDRVIQALFDSLGRMSEEEAAALVNLSPNWFSSEFKRKTGMKYRDCRVWARLSIGAVWLRTFPWLRVADIADELGYSDSIKFGIAFKKWYGLSPSAFRKSFTQANDTGSQGILFNSSRYNLPRPTCDTLLIRKTG